MSHAMTLRGVEECGGVFRPVIERHAPCCSPYGDDHDACIVQQRFVGPECSSFAEAKRWLESAEVTMSNGIAPRWEPIGS